MLLLATATALILTVYALKTSAQRSIQAQDTTGTPIEVKLIPKKKVIKVGEALEVRVEIWNVGSKPLFVQNAIYEACGPSSPLSLGLELGPPIKPQEGHACAADCVYGAKDNFEKRFFYRWTSLPSGKFYGTVVVMYPDFFPQLNTPGRWRLSGRYKSTGDLLSSPCWDTAPIPDIKEKIKALPFDGWQGEVDTNDIWIEVVRQKTS